MYAAGSEQPTPELQQAGECQPSGELARARARKRDPNGRNCTLRSCHSNCLHLDSPKGTAAVVVVGQCIEVHCATECAARQR